MRCQRHVTCTPDNWLEFYIPATMISAYVYDETTKKAKIGDDAR